MDNFRDTFFQICNSNLKFNWLTLYQSGELKEFNYEILSSRVFDYCNLYKKNNIQQNDTVLIILKESLDLFASFFAGIIYGALPAYFAYPSHKQNKETFLLSIDSLVKFNNIKLLITYPEILNTLSGHKKLAQNTLLFDHNQVQSTHKFGLENFPEPGREFFLQFSSGTTGAKKGVKISYEALRNQIEAYSEFINYNDNSKVVSWLPHYHDMGLIACMLIPFLKKIPILMMSPFEWVMNPKILFELITHYECTHVWLPNFALGHLTKSIHENELKNYNLKSIEQLVICSEPALYDTVEKFVSKFKQISFSDKSLRNCYAMAENTFAMTSTKTGPLKFISVDPEKLQKASISIKDRGKRIASAGYKLKNIDIQILLNGYFSKEDEVGEILIKSDCMLDCYHNNSVETSEAFFKGYFKTGDLGFLHNNELYITGRKKDLIIIGGENIYPQDIEMILNEEQNLIPGRNLVFGVDDELSGTEKIVILAEIEDPTKKVNLQELRTKIFNLLSISISDFILLPHMTLKKGTAGKISRYLNKIEYLNGAYTAKKTGSADKNKKNLSLHNILSNLIPSDSLAGLKNDTSLIKSGLIDSFKFLDLVNSIEKEYEIRIPDKYLKTEYFNSISRIDDLLKRLQNNEEKEIIYSENSGSFMQRLIHFFKEK